MTPGRVLAIRPTVADFGLDISRQQPVSVGNRRGYTRIPLSALYENLASGATIDEFVEWFPGVDRQQVRAVLEFEAMTLRTATAQ